MRPTLTRTIVLCLAILFSAASVSGQSAQQPEDGKSSTGIMPNVAYGGVRENINLSNGNVTLFVPLVSLPGRKGHDLVLGLYYNTKIWTGHSMTVGGGQTVFWWQQGLNVGNGWNLNLPIIVSTPGIYAGDVTPGGYQYICVANYLVDLGDQGFHAFGNRTGCVSNTTPNTPAPSKNVNVTDADDGSFFRLDTTNTNDIVVYKKDGSRIHLGSPSGVRMEDANGNLITTSTSGNTTTLVDSVNRAITLQNDPTTGNPLQIIYQDSTGVSRTIGIAYSDVTLSPSFTYPTGATQPTPVTRKFATTVTLPNNLTYNFSYNNFGEITKIVYPGGGYTRYDFAAFTRQPVNPNVADVREITARHVCTKPGGNCVASEEETTTYTPTIAATGSDWNQYLDVRDATPAHNRTNHQFSVYGPVPREIAATEYSGESTLLRSTTTDYGDLDPSTGGPQAWSQPIRTTTTLNDTGQVSKIEYDYDTYNALILHDTINQPTLTSRSLDNVVEKREFGFGSGTPGNLLRKTDMTWLKINPVNGVDYTTTAIHILDRMASEQIFDPAVGTVPISQSQFEYDNYSYGSGMSSSGAVQRDQAFGTSYTTRGNLTATKRWRNTDGVWLSTSNQFDDAGNILARTDPLNHTTSFSYVDSWGDTHCAPTGNAAAYATRVTNALGQAINNTYNSCSGTLASAKDANNLTTTHSYELMLRRTQTTNLADNGQSTACYSEVSGSSCYSSALPLSVTNTQKISATLTKTSKIIADGLGRTAQSQLTSDPQGIVYTDTTYDALGRVATVSNPYRLGSDTTSSPGITTYSYDALGRKTAETYPDGAVLTTAYCGSSTLVTDPTGKWRRSRTDALGRLVEVDEPNVVGATVAPTGCPGTGEPIWVTSYNYDILGNLTQVVQNGSHQRNFSYDSLSRLLTSSNPEVGTITYKYDLDTNCPTLNSFPTLLVSKTDARGIRTCFQYDAINRELVRNYSNGDPTVTTAYDQSNCLGLTNPPCSNIGHRTSMTDAAGSEAWSYQIDTTNFPNSPNIHKDQRTTNGITKSSTYYADLAGNVTQVVYPTGSTGRVVNYSYDSANRPSTAIDGSNGITYATGFKTSPGPSCLNNVTCYTPQGTFYALSIGQTSAFTGLNLTHIYNSRLQPQEFKASSSGGSAIDITYSFVDPATSKNAGHVYGIAYNIDTTRSQTFAYDQLNRITAAQASTFATSPGHCWQETYGLDSWGNMQSLVANANSSYTGCTYEPGFTKAADGNNHLSGFSYDASGNTTADGYNSYTWDAESQLKVTASSTYLYDGDGRRVAKANTAVPPVPYKLYWYGAGGEVLAESDASGNTAAEYIFFGGKRIAMSFPGTGVPGTGSATVNGSEQSIAGAPAASGTGSVTFSGTLQSKQVLSRAATSGTGTISISGGPDQSTSVGYVCGPNGQMCWRTVYDNGSISVTVNGFTASAGYYQASGIGSISTDLANALNASGSPVTASGGGGGVTMTAKATGTASNYPVSVSVSYDSHDFSHASFTASGPSALTGGANATYTTVYDSGTSTITVNGHADTISWSGSGTTTSSIASALASSINADSAALVSASASGASVSLTAKTTGASTNYSLSSSSTYDSTDFTSPSFTSSNSGSALTGGRDAGATIYDSGNVWVTINGTQYSVSYGQGSSSSSIASGLASAISAGSLANATASGSSISITSKINGAASDYSLSSGSSTSQGSFSSASFTVSTSGSALTGGSGGTFYYVEDLLGTSRVMTTDNGVVCYDADFYPYGGERSYTNTCPQTYKFEGKERDTETGNDEFGARYYSNRFGRWLSADWSAVPVPVPYANLSNPQTLNLYSMVSDDPESFADLDGHYICTGTRAQCTTVRDALDKARAALQGNGLSKEERAALNNVVSTFGKAGDEHDGVTISFGKTQSAKAIATAHSYKSENGLLKTDITFNSKAFGGLNSVEVAGTLVHERSHGLDGIARGNMDPQNKKQDFRTEMRAYNVESYIPKGLGVQYYEGTVNQLWNPNWAPNSAEASRFTGVFSGAITSTSDWCGRTGAPGC
jgi:RHS repeat-associated protein